MKIVQYLRDGFSWMKSKIQAARSRWRDDGPEIGHTVAAQVAGFLTGPLSETEYALLKRVSGIMGTAVALYLIVAAGPITALVVLGLCLLLALGLHQLSGPGLCSLPEPSSVPIMA